MVVTISHAGYIKRTHPSAYRAQKRGGKGKIGMEAREEDWVTQLFVASTHAYVFFFSDRGKVYVKKVFEIPIAPRTAKGRAIVNFVGMEPGEKVAAIVEVPKIEEGKFIATITKRGQIKKTEVTEYENFRQKGIIGVKIEGDDQLLSAALTDGQREFLIATKMGQSIRFQEDQVRPMGRGTVGTGRIDRGIVKVGEAVEIVGLRETVMKSVCTGVEMFQKTLDQGQAGDNVGILLRGVEKKDLERGMVVAKPGTITPHTKFEAEVYILSKEEGGRHTPFFSGYRPQFYFRTTDVTGTAKLLGGAEMCMPGDNVKMEVELLIPVAMDEQLRFAIREGGRTVGAGVVTKILK